MCSVDSFPLTRLDLVEVVSGPHRHLACNRICRNGDMNCTIYITPKHKENFALELYTQGKEFLWLSAFVLANHVPILLTAVTILCICSRKGVYKKNTDALLVLYDKCW